MQLVFLSTHPPRRCGLASFTADLRAALAVSVPRWRVDTCAVDRDGLVYGPEAAQVLRQDDRDDYRRAARALADRGTDLVVIQHEYGIFGGHAGGYLLDFASELTTLGVPYAVTAHTVLSAATPAEAGALAGVCRGATRVTGFTESARAIATRAGWVEPDRFAVVPHGVPLRLSQPTGLTEVGPELADALSATAGSRMLSSFGLLRRGKGLETAIRALPEVIARHPDVTYVIAGATHPETTRRNGEAYRSELTTLVRELGLTGHVWFVDAFLTEPELAALLQRTELYLTPYRSVQQTCSGALTFALAAGAPVVSTSYRYAVDLLTPPDGPARGALVPFDDPAALAGTVCDLLGDPQRLAAAREAARSVGASLSWPAVGARFAEVFAAAVPADRVASVRTRPADLSELVAGTRVDRSAPPGGEPAWSPNPRPSASTGRAS